MRFVKTEELKTGMRIARPIYNKSGVLLYERDSKLAGASINSIKNFGLIGIFILEPAEPCPPMSEDDIEFERFQTVQVYALESELKDIILTKRTKKIDIIAAAISKNYGHLNKKINFSQNLRSKDDYVYKHTLNVAMLSALISHRMNVSVEEANDAVMASLVHDIGKLMISDSATRGASDDELEAMYEISQTQGYEFIGQIFSASPNIKRICVQANKQLSELKAGRIPEKIKLVTGTKILLVAETYDAMTAMSLSGEPASEVEALRYLTKYPEVFEPKVVDALVNSINILNEGTCVVLSNGEKALVVSTNSTNVLQPMVLAFSKNEIMDLSNRRLFDDIEIVDIMKTMDDRYVMDGEALNKYGV